jgi:hypothetical protein
MVKITENPRLHIRKSLGMKKPRLLISKSNTEFEHLILIPAEDE